MRIEMVDEERTELDRLDLIKEVMGEGRSRSSAEMMMMVVAVEEEVAVRTKSGGGAEEEVVVHGEPPAELLPLSGLVVLEPVEHVLAFDVAVAGEVCGDLLYPWSVGRANSAPV